MFKLFDYFLINHQFVDWFLDQYWINSLIFKAEFYMDKKYKKIGLLALFELKSFFNGNCFFLKRNKPYNIYRNKDGSVTVEQNGEGGEYSHDIGTYTHVYSNYYDFEFKGVKTDGSKLELKFTSLPCYLC